jgi:hypothetical protein
MTGSEVLREVIRVSLNCRFISQTGQAAQSGQIVKIASD